MVKQFKYVSIFLLIICVFVGGCGDKGTEKSTEPSYDDNVIYAPVDTTQDPNTDESDTDTTVPDDSDVTEPITPDDTADTDGAADADDTTEPTDDTEDAEADSDQTEETESVDAPSVHAGVIMIGEDFSTGEHAAGSIVSKESEKIRLVVSYDCGMNEDGGITVALEVGLECYDVNCGPRANGGTVSVNGNTHTFSTDEIVHEEAGMIYIPLETYIQQLDAQEKSCTVEASWFFNGVYAGVKIDTLTVSATLDWSANN